MPQGRRTDGQSMSRNRLKPFILKLAAKLVAAACRRCIPMRGAKSRTAKGMAIAALTVTTISGAMTKDR